MNLVENIDEVEQISLLTNCTTKLHRYHRINPTFLFYLHQSKFWKIHLPFITFPRLYSIFFHVKKHIHSLESGKGILRRLT